MTNDEFFKSLSDADWDKAEAIESEIGRLLSEGFTEEVGLKFVRTVMGIQLVMPKATVSGIYDAALSAGLSHVGEQVISTLPATKPASAGHIKQKRKPGAGSKLTGAGI